MHELTFNYFWKGNRKVGVTYVCISPFQWHLQRVTRFINQLGYLASCFLAGVETEDYSPQIFYVSTNVLFRLRQLLAQGWWFQLLLKQVTSLFSILVYFLRLWQKPLTKGNMGRQGLISSYITKETEGRDSKQEPACRKWCSAPEKCCLRVCFQWLAACLLIKPRTNFPGWSPPTPIINQENTYEDFLVS